MEGDPNTGASEAAESPITTEVVRGDVAGDIQIVTRTDDPTGAPAESQSDPSQATADEARADDADAEATAAAAADQADLETYPESVRDYLKGIPQEHRKTLHEHFGQRERARMEEERQRADRLEAANRAAEQQAQTLRETQGKFVGQAPIELIDQNGNTYEGPTYAELTDLMLTQRGRDTLLNKYGLDEDRAEGAKAELDQRRAMLEGSAGHFENVAWGQLAFNMRSGLQAINGVDAEAVIAEAARVASEGGNGPATVLAQVVAARDAEHAREMAAVKRDYEGQLATTNVNAEGLRGRVVAAESRRLPTGGRTGGSPMTTLERLKAEAGSPEQFAENAKNGLYAGIDLTK